jgi:Holliday junction resolvasome RuvABC endonuclease subunit
MSTVQYRTLNIDPALSICGWSVLDLKLEQCKNVQVIPKVVVNRFGCIMSSSEANKVLLRESIDCLIREFKPNFMVIEDAFYNPKFPSAYASLLQCICTISVMCRDRYNLPVYRIPTRSAKQTIFGTGSANKKDIIEAVLSSPNIVFKQKKSSALIGEHEADSIAIGYHFMLNNLPGLLSSKQSSET